MTSEQDAVLHAFEEWWSIMGSKLITKYPTAEPQAFLAGAEWQRERDARVVDEYYSGYDGVMRVRQGKPDEYVGLMENVAERIRKGDA